MAIRVEHPRSSALALACAAAFAFADYASAQDADLSGAWEFRTTDEETRGCMISGTAQISPGAKPGLYAIDMHADQTCAGYDGHSRSHQACKGLQSGDFIRVSCVLISSESAFYIADGYDLDVVDAETMEGALTVLWDAPAVWRRANGGVA